MTLYQKIKEARKLLKMTQKQMSNSIGIPQKDISLLESGKKLFIPNEYIQYLYNMNIDINSLYEVGSNVRFRTDAKVIPNLNKEVERTYNSVSDPNSENIESNDLLKNMSKFIDDRIEHKLGDIEDLLYTMLASLKAKELKEELTKELDKLNKEDKAKLSK